ncbi:membrane dipeptidase [Rhodococcus sp. PAMC28707]|uniref:dipeptidase n=1 Tax=unclassified Rhodococcus (in: high G+C Gram-positive bacteria) TaxID=192944 RepID=UPI00109DE49E|nr:MULTISPECIES: membrane dipeptidase [unclassified Rhodococcus (in: high G+C Gram-positive bacteria)]QCB48964.1 membrane dipeptidase [Rhodococcus sp. PAMC28705]QCB59349.1 membrane dipeptidase [Rhodococcus sp. PAMC28707]
MNLWEQHCCLPLVPTADITELARYPLGSYVSVNVGFSPHSKAVVTALAQDFRRKALADGRFRMVDAVDEPEAVELITLAFDLEDSGPLEGDLDNIRYFHGLGVRSMLPTYNHANAAGGGCLDVEDTGLTAYGRDVVREMNRVGMLVDGSHCSVSTGLDVARCTEHPMIYSHSNFAALWQHPRNITDEQALECARTTGVVGINGVGIFLGVNAPEEDGKRVQAMADHIEYGVELLGIEHVGIGSDYSFDHEDFDHELRIHPEAFSEMYTRWGPLQWVPPEGTLTLPAVLRGRGFDEHAVDAVFGGNFRRVAEATQAATGR